MNKELGRKIAAVILLYLFLFQFYSCNKEKKYPKWILGEWISNEGIFGYYFISKDSCEVRPGYIDPDFNKHPRKYYGNTTAYQISKDTLRIFNLENNNWEMKIISFLSPDTMIVYWNGDFSHQTEYYRAKYPISKENLFDQIVIHDPFNKDRTLSLDSSGILFYSGHSSRETEIRGLYTSNQGKRAFKQIERLFKEANSKSVFIDTFPARIDSTYSWLTPTITFIKNNRMATIAGPVWGTDVLYAGYDQKYFSKEFIWAYKQSLYLEQQMPIQPFIKPHYWLDSWNFEYDGFFIPVVYGLNLYDSERFYLWTKILKAKQVDVDFTPRYTVNDRIQSDGRYFRYKTKQGDTITLDLGFNFVEENNITKPLLRNKQVGFRAPSIIK